jgi:hypothetical protein
MSYIEEKVEEFENIAFGIVGEVNNGKEIAQLTILFEDTMSSLLLKCKEAVGEEEIIENDEEDDRKIWKAIGSNARRSTTLQNLDNLEK